MYVKPTRCAVVALCIGIGLLTAGNAFGQFLPGGGVNTSDPNLPPDSGAYLTPADVHAMYH
ncbi:MAG: hypothetical protein HY288_16250, partial [Planctomycetia bacterium]|nr:hypothetical protein [Planctomycetia bacterium]